MIKIKLTDNFNFYNEVKLTYANPDLDLWNRFVSINNKKVTKINIEKGCIHMTQKSKTVKVKCNRDCINNSNFCEKHNL